MIATLDIGRNSLVPICVPKSAMVKVALLAILKAGGTCVMLDVNHPDERLRQIVSLLNCKAILVSADQSSRFRGMDLQEVVLAENALLLKRSSQMNGSWGGSPRVSPVSPKNAAFAVFSSGSTGTPKAILLSHEAICTSAKSQAESMGIGSRSRALQFSSYAFDVSIYEIFIPLIHGGCVCVPSEKGRVTDLAQYMRNEAVNWAVLTPSVVSTLSPAEVPQLKVLNLTGECPTQANINIWARQVTLVNAYGSSEASTCAPARLAPQSPPNYIGRLVGARGWIVNADDSSKLLPVGCIGELVVEGHVVASGYLNDEKKTKSAFIEHPQWLPELQSLNGGSPPRLFKTGDLVQYRDDGSMIYLGRKDMQIRLRGHRIQPALIEAKINQLLPLASSVVVDITRPEFGSTQSLVAFLAFEKDQEGYERYETFLIPTQNSLEQLRRVKSLLASQLPTYMVPTAFVTICSIPTLITKKIDYFKLRKLGSSMPISLFEKFTLSNQSANAAKLDPREKEMLRLWSLALGRQIIAENGMFNFLAIGGDSIGAIKLISIARREGHNLEYSRILQDPTLSSMARLLSRFPLQRPELAASEPFSLIEHMTNKSKENTLRQVMLMCNLGEEEISDVYPCTPLQEGMLALSLKQEGTYLAQNVFKLSPEMDPESFKSIWETVVNQTDSLRSRFVMLGSGEFVQVIAKTKMQWSVADSLTKFLTSDQKEHFQLGVPSCRFALILDKPGETYFVWTAHHATYDAWTVSLLLRKIVLVNQGFALPPSVSYSRLISHISLSDKSASASFWSSKLAGLEAVPFPASTANLTHDVQRERWTAHTFPFQPSTKSGITASTIIQAAWALVVSQHTSSRDVVFGQILSGRNTDFEGVDEVVGLVSATVPVRIRIDQNSSVYQLLSSIQQGMLEIASHQHFGLLNIRRLNKDAESACAFQNILIIDPREEEDLDNLKQSESILTKVSEGEVSSRAYPLHLRCSINSDSVSVEVRYDEDVLESTQVDKLIYQFRHALGQLGELEGTIRHIEVLSPEDKSQILQWNSDMPVRHRVCVHQTISQWAKDTPFARAVDGHDGTLSFEELEAFSSRLACRLLQLNCYGQMVPLCFQKSSWTIVALMAVLKAGAAFVPLDPSHPTDRLLEICRQCNAQTILVSPLESGRFRGQVKHIIPFTTQDSSDISLALDTKLPVVSPDADAYIIFTSGTTGKPKGVIIQHSALSSSVGWQGAMMKMNKDTRALEFASYAFDAMILETILVLVHGGCVCVPSEDERLQLQDVMTKMNINWAALNPSVARTISPDKVRSLRTLVVGGEPLSLDLANRWAGRVSLLNMCGPTETCVFCCGTEVDASAPDPRCIGRCMNSRSWIVDSEDSSRLVPIGAVGELVIEGPILSRGYIGDEERSKDVFIQHPQWLCPGWDSNSLVYKTGDLVSYKSDGTLRIFGRKDTQVKIRGNRMELPEVERHIKDVLFNAVFAVVDIIQTPVSDTKHLAAFVCKTEKFEVTQSHSIILEKDSPIIERESLEVQVALKHQLPEYMIPTAWVCLRVVPVTTSGKVNRRILKTIGAEIIQRRLTEVKTSSLSPLESLTESQNKLAVLWAKVLSLETADISVNSNFLALGGDSFSTMRLSAACREEGLLLTVKDVFQNATLSRMAEQAHTLENDDLELGPTNVSHSPESAERLKGELARPYHLDSDLIRDVFPCSPLQNALLTLSLQHEGSYICCLVFKLPEEIDINRFQRAWEQVYRLHEILRTTYILDREAMFFQVILDRDLDWLAESPTLQRSTSPMELGSPMSQFALLDRTFTLTIHHASYDGVSLRRILSDVENAYYGSEPSSSTSMKPFITHLETQDLKAADRFWRLQLSDFQGAHFPALSSPDYAPRADTVLEHTIPFVRPQLSTVTPATIIRAAWAILMCQYTGSDDIILGVTLNGRSFGALDMANVMGPTIATVPVRFQIRKSEKISEFMYRVQDQAAEMTTFEQTRMQSIRKCGPGAVLACDFQTLLSIETPQDTDPPLQVFSSENVVGEQTHFHTNALTIECTIMHSGLAVKTYFDSKLIASQQIKRMIAQLDAGLSQIRKAKVNTTIGDINWFSDADMQELSIWNDAYLVEEDRLVHTEFQRMVIQQPNADAICAWDGQFSYEELDCKSTILAKVLVHLINPQEYVPICFEKSLWAVVAMLAILKAGGAYIPLDPNYPRARCKQIISDAQSTVLICSPSSAKLCADLAPTILVLTPDSELWVENEDNTQLPTVSPNHATFALFTSGSTGKPKGIVIEHAGFCFGAEHHSKTLHIQSSSRVFQFASYVFDVSFSDIFATLMQGGCVCIPSESERINDLSGAIARFHATQVFLTPTVAKTIFPSQVPDLKVLVIGGEAPTREVLKQWGSSLNLIVVWGPAECTVYSSSHENTKPDDHPACIGRSLGCNLWITDPDNHNRLAPLGTIGEILVEGPIVARGYINDPSRTAAAFVSDPEWTKHGSSQDCVRRFYRTSDMGRYMPDGNIYFTGRRDAQVKIRGQRVELPEIEFQLRTLDTVEHAVVEVPPSGRLANRLVAVVTLQIRDSTRQSPDSICIVENQDDKLVKRAVFDIREHLSDRVPGYMVPDMFLILQAMPLMVSGKLHRSQIKAWLGGISEGELAAARKVMEEDIQDEAQSPIEKTLCGIWSAVLGHPIDQIGTNIPFFSLGGDSISAMQVSAKARSEGLNITVQDVIRSRTVARLAALPHIQPNFSREEEHLIENSKYVVGSVSND